MRQIESTEMPIILNIILKKKKKTSFLKCKRMIHLRKRRLFWALACPKAKIRLAPALLQPVRTQLENKANGGKNLSPS